MKHAILKLKFNKVNLILLAELMLLTIFLFFPDRAHAMDAIYKVLKSDTGVGGSVKSIWKNVKDLVNYLVVAVLIFVAFAQILHININTYGIKKILPALVLAVIGANLSYFLCRLLVDVANVILTLFIQSDVDTSADTSFVNSIKILTDSQFTSLATAGDFFVLFIQILLTIAGAIMILILAFLLLARNWMIYFLVVLGPLAFMATVLPQSKNIFSQWWNQLLKWTFMPIISIFWLWLGAKWSASIVSQLGDVSTSASTSGWLMKSVFAMACFYLAITTPLKMGGPIMQQWAGLGKKAWGKTGGVVTKNFGTALGNRASAQWMHQTTKAADVMKGIPGLRKFVGGLERSEKALEDAKRGRAALAEEFKGEYVKNRGTRRQRWLLNVESKEGEEKYQEALARGALVDNERDRAYVSKKRFNRAQAFAKMEEAEKGFAAFDSEMKKNLFKLKDSSGRELDPNSSEYIERGRFIQRYGNSLLRAEIEEREAKKASGDPMKKAAEDRIATHNVANEQEVAAELARKLNEYRNLLTTGGDQNEISRLKDELLSSGLFDEAELAAKEVGKTITTFGEIVAGANQNVEDRIKEIFARHNVSDLSQLPPHLQDLMYKDLDDGTTKLKPLDTLEYTRLNQYLGAEIRDGASVVNDRFSVREIMNSLVHGNTAEGFKASEVQNYFAGKTSGMDPDTTRKIQEFIVAAQKSLGNRVNVDTRAIINGITTGLVNSASVINSTSIRGLEKIISQTKEMADEKDRAVFAKLAQVNREDKLAYAKTMGNTINELFVAGGKKTRNALTSAIKSSPEAGFGGSQTKQMR